MCEGLFGKVCLRTFVCEGLFVVCVKVWLFVCEVKVFLFGWKGL